MKLHVASRFRTFTIRLSLVIGVLLVSITMSGQSDKKIIFRMLDSRTGQPITGAEYVISFEKLPDLSKISGLDPYWKEGGQKNGILDIPFEADDASIVVHSNYGPANWGYVNCDSVKTPALHRAPWYPIKQILQSGIAAPNDCNSRKAVAKPGEFVFFVRPMTFWEKMRT